MRIGVASDHRGFKLKKYLLEYLKSKGHKVRDLGTFSQESCDYPLYCFQLARLVAGRKVERGIFICKTGIGSSIALNKVKGIRAALVYNLKGARLSRLHNDANILVLGSEFIRRDYAKRIVSIWLKSVFEGGRHLRRINQIRKLEEGCGF